MRNFHRLAFDAYVSGTAPAYSDPNLHTLFGNVDQLAIGGYTSQVSGTSPKIEVQVEHSIDNTRWQNRNTTAEIPNTTTLSTTAETVVAGNDGDPTARPTLAFARLRITLSGTTPAGQIRLWVTGRDKGEG